MYDEIHMPRHTTLTLWISLLSFGCGAKDSTTERGGDPGETDPCSTAAATADCLSPRFDPDYYVTQAHKYFNTMDTAEDRDDAPFYSEWVVRWEWPPWLLLTAFGADHIENTDLLLRAYPSTIPDRDCRFFETQPFARCRVTFYYEDESHEGRGCPIYEEFAFNDAGEMTVIEAWSDLEGLRPMNPSDDWAEEASVHRLSTKIPGLGTPDGQLDINGQVMAEAAASDPELADLVYRANNWTETWTDAYEAAGDTLWSDGCGW
mgnify:CR=1 FL=1